MAEVVGLAASIAGLATTAGAAFKISQSMFHIARKIHFAQEEIEDFGRDISSFATVIHFAHTYLNHYENVLRIKSPVLEFMESRAALSNLVIESQRVIDYISQLKKPLKSMEGRIKWWMRVKWAWQSRDVKALGPKMASVKSSLTLVISILSLEAAHQKNDSEEISALRLQIEVQLETIKILRRREMREASRKNVDHLGHISHLAVSNNSSEGIQDILVDIGNNMRDHGELRALPVTVSESSPTRSDQRGSVEADDSNSDNEDSDECSERSFTSDNSSMHSYKLPRDRESRFRAPARRARNHPHFAGDARKDTTEKYSQSFFCNSNVRGESAHEFSLKKRRQSPPRTGKLVLYRDFRTEPGQAHHFITSQNQHITIRAQLDDNLTHNVISERCARDLGLDVCTEAEAAELWLKGQRFESSGTVVLIWGGTERDIQADPLDVQCFVFKHGVEDIALGQEFITQRRRHEYDKWRNV